MTKLLNLVRTAVSGDKYRYIDDEYNLDLTYITDRIIAMAFPAEGMESSYRNDIDQVARFLNAKHNNHYLILNLSERRYNYSLFHNNVLEFPFPDHHNPPLGLLFECCNCIDSWLKSDPKNVVAAHCLAGRGRTGTVLACALNFLGKFKTANAALDFFAQKRSEINRGVANPSQRRYVEYFTQVLNGNVDPSPRVLLLRKIILTSIPRMDGSNVFRPSLSISIGRRLVYTSNDSEDLDESHNMYRSDNWSGSEQSIKPSSLEFDKPIALPPIPSALNNKNGVESVPGSVPGGIPGPTGPTGPTGTSTTTATPASDSIPIHTVSNSSISSPVSTSTGERRSSFTGLNISSSDSNLRALASSPVGRMRRQSARPMSVRVDNDSCTFFTPLNEGVVVFDVNTLISSDVLIQLNHHYKSLTKSKKQSECLRLGFHTAFLRPKTITVPRTHIDGPHKDIHFKKFDGNFAVQLVISPPSSYQIEQHFKQFPLEFGVPNVKGGESPIKTMAENAMKSRYRRTQLLKGSSKTKMVDLILDNDEKSSAGFSSISSSSNTRDSSSSSSSISSSSISSSSSNLSQSSKQDTSTPPTKSNISLNLGRDSNPISYSKTSSSLDSVLPSNKSSSKVLPGRRSTTTGPAPPPRRSRMSTISQPKSPFTPSSDTIEKTISPQQSPPNQQLQPENISINQPSNSTPARRSSAELFRDVSMSLNDQNLLTQTNLRLQKAQNTLKSLVLDLQNSNSLLESRLKFVLSKLGEYRSIDGIFEEMNSNTLSVESQDSNQNVGTEETDVEDFL